MDVRYVLQIVTLVPCTVIPGYVTRDAPGQLGGPQTNDVILFKIANFG